MYDIALSVSACARSGTRADVAWMVSPRASDEAIAFTPGGGRIGSLCGGAFDGLLADVAARQHPIGKRVLHTVTSWESEASGLAEGTAVEFLVVAASGFPPDTWPRVLQREALAITVTLSGDDVTEVGAAGSDEAQGLAGELLARGACGVSVEDDAIVTCLVPVTRLVIAGGGPIAEALAANAALLGWKVAVETRPDHVLGLTAALSPLDAVVVMGHDVESSSRNLMSALASDAGYIGALGSRKMQDDRAEWLAYREVTDTSRVHGPAGIDIGAHTPAQIAVSVLAEAIATLVGDSTP